MVQWIGRWVAVWQFSPDLWRSNLEDVVCQLLSLQNRCNETGFS